MGCLVDLMLMLVVAAGVFLLVSLALPLVLLALVFIGMVILLGKILEAVGKEA